MILALRTDRPEAELYLVDTDGVVIDSHQWYAHKELSKTLLNEIETLLESDGISHDMLSGIVVFRGPGSFTGLRIGVSVANAFADGLGIAIIAADGDNWLSQGVRRLARRKNDKLVLPEYGGEANITKPRK